MNEPRLHTWLQEHHFSVDDINALGESGLTPLMRAARQGDADMIHTLLRNGAQLAARNADGNNALWFACVGEHLDIIALLVTAGIDINNQNDNGATALMYASSTGKESVLKTLLNTGADTTLKSLDDYTALDVAATIGCLQLLRNNQTKS